MNKPQKLDLNEVKSLTARKDYIAEHLYDSHDDYRGKTLHDHIKKASNLIHKHSLRGPANYIATSKSRADIIEAIANFDFIDFREEVRYNVIGLDDIPDNEIYVFRISEGYKYIPKITGRPPEIELLIDEEFPKGTIKYFVKLAFRCKG